MSGGPFPDEVAADAATAWTLPSRYYLDPALPALEAERVFGRSWQWAASLADLQRPGDHVPTEVAGEPVLLVRGEDGKLQALSNVCRHRAGPVARSAGHARSLTCGYHGWRYALDGALVSARDVGDLAGFDVADVRLPELAVDTWGGFAFVDVSGTAPPLADVLAEIVPEARAAGLEPTSAPPTLVAQRTDEFDCNWKVYVDNYLEGYHVPFVHPRLHRILDTPRYRVELRERHSRQHAPVRPGNDDVYGDTGDEAILYYWLFPNVMLNLYPGNIQVNVVTPLGAERTRTWFGWFATGESVHTADAAGDLAAAVELAGEVQHEDVEICVAVQLGLRSTTYDRGRYAERHERGVHHFHRLLLDALAPR
ncbi:MAG: putative oxidoreductase [Acidimicrobiales bacterium]|nr:putative oxidoreductase [Acidimicrobiales bacterium]